MTGLFAFLAVLLDLNISASNNKLITIALVLGIVIMVVIIVGWIVGHLSAWRRGP